MSTPIRLPCPECGVGDRTQRGKRELARSLGAHGTFSTARGCPREWTRCSRPSQGHCRIGEGTQTGGIIVCSGATTGDADRAELQRLFFLQLRMVGSTMGTRDELRDLLSFLDVTGVRPHIGAVLPLSDAKQAFTAMLDGDTAGKIVFTR